MEPTQKRGCALGQNSRDYIEKCGKLEGSAGLSQLLVSWDLVYECGFTN